MTKQLEFDIHVTMESRWVPHFLSMLRYMQKLGSIGASRQVTLYADGDGDFHPQFEWSEKLDAIASPLDDADGNRTYDAG